jgi:Protein of unknown function (DUF4238)
MEESNYCTVIQDMFICVWEAEEPFEFILTDNAFGIFEGNCGRGLCSLAYHYFYPISPRRVLVHARITFKSNDTRALLS